MALPSQAPTSSVQDSATLQNLVNALNAVNTTLTNGAAIGTIATALATLNTTITAVFPSVQGTSAGNTNSTWTGYMSITLPNGSHVSVPYV